MLGQNSLALSDYQVSLNIFDNKYNGKKLSLGDTFTKISYAYLIQGQAVGIEELNKISTESLTDKEKKQFNFLIEFLKNKSREEFIEALFTTFLV